MPTKIDYLSTYFKDHRAGATGGSNLAHRLAEENVGTPYEDFLTLLSQQIDEDVGTLESIMGSFGVEPSMLKDAGAAIGEKLGKLKPNEHLASYSPLSRVQELEMMRSGVVGKLGLWQSLHAVSDSDPRLDAARLESLIVRAESQIAGLTELHAMASREAFTN